MGIVHAEAIEDRELRALVDHLLLEQGRLDPLELLMAAGLLGYADYEAWRTGQAPSIESVLHTRADAAADLLQRAGTYASNQKLETVRQVHNGWAPWERSLRVGTHPELVAALSHSFVPPSDRRQLDLFQDSSTRIMEDHIRRSLAERRIADARAQLVRLEQQNPGHEFLRGFERLLQVIEGTGHRSGVGPATNGASGAPAGKSSEVTHQRQASDRWDELEGLEPLAYQLLGYRARDFLAPLWADLAERLTALAGQRAFTGRHPCHAWARAGRWSAVRTAVEAQSDWQREPELVLAHAEACWHLRAVPAARRDWLGLCWRHPRIAERILGARSLPDHWLADCWCRFDDRDDELDTADFPAWVLLAEPGIAKALPGEEAPTNDQGDAYRLVVRLVTGCDAPVEIAVRRELAATRPALLRLYLARQR